MRIMNRLSLSPILRRLIRTAAPLSLALVFAVSLTACDSTDSNSDDTNEAPPETVSMTIGGADVEMNAFFATGTDPETGEDGFIVYLTEADNLSGGSAFQSGDAFGIMGRLSSRPGTGSYSVVDISRDDSDELLRDQFAFIYFEGVGTMSQRIVVSSGGTVEISTSTNDRVAGSFDIDALSTTFSGSSFSEESVSIDGTFDASNVPFFVPDDIDF